MSNKINHSIYIEHKIVEMLTLVPVVVPTSGDVYFDARFDLGNYVLKHAQGDPNCGIMSLGEYEFKGWITEPEKDVTHFWINEITRHVDGMRRVLEIPEQYDEGVNDKHGYRLGLTMTWYDDSEEGGAE